MKHDSARFGNAGVDVSGMWYRVDLAIRATGQGSPDFRLEYMPVGSGRGIVRIFGSYAGDQ